MGDDQELVVIRLPLRHPEDWQGVKQMLSENDLIIPGNYKARDPYDLTRYLYTAHEKGHNFRALFDRNLVSRLVLLAKGMPLSKEPASGKVGRLAAACQAFCILAEMQIEPNMALYEYASSSSHDNAVSDFRHFLLADNVDPRYYIDIALGREDCLPRTHLVELECKFKFSTREVEETNFEKPLNSWKPHYLFVLKTVSLVRSGITPYDAAHALLHWQSYEAFYNAAATLFCLAAIGHTPPSGGMIKKIKSSNMAELRKGVRNATWDICLVSQWGKYPREGGKTFWAFCSNDRALREMAKLLLIGVQESSENSIANFLRTFWGERDGNRLANIYFTSSDNIDLDSPERTERRNLASAKVDSWIQQLEDELRLPWLM